ncbi:DUF4190 domain-containing protein [Protaetiibacter intestinalis]|uniref:DUF4190 domain-containing protein n=1 Tax=Protaetiibacter intestinalis TaxID=2419774 RepID=A0A387B6Y6_9MICO|nr:DUF4190 domain-containing protein [Protaetiibacter intestinalis]AYF96879.1 DUF4190 domain-containing protein [Protaetiibacter intestinalis]
MNDTITVPAPDEAPAQPAAEAPANPYAVPAQPAAASAASAGTGLSISSLVLGIVSIPTGLAVAAIVAIVLGFIARGREPQGRTTANWGIVLGFVGLFGWVLFAVLGFAAALPFLVLAPFWY